MNVKFDSSKDSFKSLSLPKEVSIIQYNSVFRLNYKKLELIIGRFQLVESNNGIYLYLYDVVGNSSGILELKEGGWIY